MVLLFPWSESCDLFVHSFHHCSRYYLPIHAYSPKQFAVVSDIINWFSSWAYPTHLTFTLPRFPYLVANGKLQVPYQYWLHLVIGYQLVNQRTDNYAELFINLLACKQPWISLYNVSPETSSPLSQGNDFKLHTYLLYFVNSVKWFLHCNNLLWIDKKKPL